VQTVLESAHPLWADAQQRGVEAGSHRSACNASYTGFMVVALMMGAG
jgi:hypothetical protein